MIQILIDEKKDRKNGYVNCCHVIVDDHGIKQKKIITTETLCELFEKSTKREKKEISIGKVPRGYLATKYQIQDYPKLKSKTAIFLKEDIRRIIYKTNVYEIPIPNLLMIHSVIENGCVSTQLFCLEKNMNLDKVGMLLEKNTLPKLYLWPFANVDKEFGKVCYGSNAIRKIEKLSDLDILPILFFDSPMNDDYYGKSRTVLEKSKLHELLDFLNGQKEFPYEILKEYCPSEHAKKVF